MVTYLFTGMFNGIELLMVTLIGISINQYISGYRFIAGWFMMVYDGLLMENPFFLMDDNWRYPHDVFFSSETILGFHGV